MKKIFVSISRYLLFLIPLTGLVISFFVAIPEKYNTPVAGIITSMLPMIFTIVTIALSLPSETIYGVSSTTFRKIRKDWHFTFVEMIMITIMIFSFYTIFAILRNTIAIWCLDFISIFYSILFVIQEIPILLKNDDKLLKIVRNCWETNGEKNLKYGNASKGNDLYNIIQYLVLKLGVKETYQALKSNGDKSSSNSRLMVFLLTSNNDFMFECAEKKDYLSSNHCSQFNNIDILKAIDMSFYSLEDCLSNSNDFNIIEICGNADFQYQLTQLTYSLKRLTDSLNLTDRFQSILESILHFASYDKPERQKEECFRFDFLNKMVSSTVSSGEMWFLEALRDSEFYSAYSTGKERSYVIFLSIYFYFLLDANKKVSQELKNRINSFLFKRSEGMNSGEENFQSIIQHIFELMSFDDSARMLSDLLFFIGDDRHSANWYWPPHTNSWSSEDGVFDRAFIINCWLVFLACSEKHYDFNETIFRNVISSLSKDDQNLFAYQMNQYWFNDNIFKANAQFTNYLKFYGMDESTISESNSNIISCVCKLKNEINKRRYQDERMNANINDIDFNRIKSNIISKFNVKRNTIPFIDETIDLTKEKEFSYAIRLDTYRTEQLANIYCDKFSDSFKSIVYKEFKKTAKNNSDNILENPSKAFESMKCYQKRNQRLFLLQKYGFNNIQIDELSKIKPIDIWLPGVVMWNENSIRFNIKCDEEMTVVRALKADEINYIIDHECKITGGLYKLNNVDENKSIFVTREEIYNIIQNKYIYAFIAFKFKLILDESNILYLPDIEASQAKRV